MSLSNFEETGLIVTNISESEEQSKQNRANFCLVKWEGIRVAFDLTFVSSIKLTTELPELLEKERPLKLLCFNANLKKIDPIEANRDHVLMLNRIDYQVGIYCDNVEFLNSEQQVERFEIPVSMRTNDSPISQIVRLEDEDYFDIDLVKLCDIYISKKKSKL